MKPAWDSLGDEFADSKTVVIGDVDCTVHKELCGKFGVKGYPTVKYFSGSTGPTGDSYDGARDLESLKKFASENLGPSCGADNKDLCDDEQLAVIAEAEALSAEDLEAAINEKADAIDALEKEFKAGVENLNKMYKEMSAKAEEGSAALSPGLALYRSVQRAGEESADGHDEL